MNSLFASSVIYSFQIFALTLFLVVPNLHKEVLAPQKGLVPFLLFFVSFALCSLGNNHKKKPTVFLAKKKLIARSLFNYIHFTSMLTLERILNSLIMVYLTLVYFS